DLWQGYAQGRAGVSVDLVAHSGINQPSVVLTIPGTSLAGEVVVLGGHLDSTAFGSGNPEFLAPGADDNASGIAVLSEVIRVAMAAGFFPQRTVQFMGYAAEEIGLVGSQDIAAAYQAAGTDVVAVLQLDMTGYFGSVEDIGILSDFTDGTLTAFLGELVDTYQPELLWTTTACGYGCSDHAAWHLEGFPAAMSFESRFGQHNPEIHTTADTLATLGDNVDHAYKFARLGLAFMVEIGKGAIVGVFADGFESGSTAAWSQTVP
ncbi:MAG: M20/M25/M40 family metallo-hydrolase, partial [Actinomycetia bacterium]|nr:M20/M25/M40 family metallo-hydrolase [Actinomycetes bacterium]